jgi:sugar lactone lactonase YvrE
LAIDEDNRFANTRFPAGTLGTFVKVGSNPTVILSSDYPIAIAKDGNLYFQSGAAGHLRLMKMTPSGETSVVADFPRTVKGEPLQYTSGISAGPDGSLYYSEDTAIRRLDATGRFSTLVTVRAPTNPPSIPGTDQHSYLRGFAIDDWGATYVCDTGDARVLKLDRDGTLTQVLQTQSPWAPTAVATFGRTVYVLEYLHTANDVRREWSPRVRKIAGDGTSTIIATLDQMPGAR